MSVECASCGQVIPAGQFRCGGCGAVQARENFDDYGGLTEVSADGDGVVRAVGPEGGSPATARVAAAAEDEEAGGAREPLVPRGTFTSELPERATEPDEREGTRESKTAKSTATPPAGTSQRIKAVRSAPRPPYLASEILREDLAPSEPGRRLLEIVLQVAPALGAIAALASGIDRPATWVALVLLAGLFVLTRFEASYAAKTLLVTALGGGALASVSLWRVSLGAGADDPLLAGTVTLLSAALLFRGWHRAAVMARALVAGALVLGAAWAAMTSHRELLSLAFSWDSWLPALTWYLFGIISLLSLLAFMGPETTGGCDAWAFGLWGWYGLFACVRFALEAPAEAGWRGPDLQTLGLVEPAFAAPASLALGQLFARTLGAFGLRGRRTADGDALGPS